MQKLVDKVNLVSREILTGLSVIRAFGREEQEEKRFDEANRDLTRTMLFTNRAMTFMMPLMMIIMNLISVLIVWVSANHIDAGTLEVGTMTAFITYADCDVLSDDLYDVGYDPASGGGGGSYQRSAEHRTGDQ